MCKEKSRSAGKAERLFLYLSHIQPGSDSLLTPTKISEILYQVG